MTWALALYILGAVIWLALTISYVKEKRPLAAALSSGLFVLQIFLILGNIWLKELQVKLDVINKEVKELKKELDEVPLDKTREGPRT